MTCAALVFLLALSRVGNNDLVGHLQVPGEPHEPGLCVDPLPVVSVVVTPPALAIRMLQCVMCYFDQPLRGSPASARQRGQKRHCVWPFDHGHHAETCPLLQLQGAAWHDLKKIGESEPCPHILWTEMLECESELGDKP